MLVVDDNASARLLLRRLLQKMTFEVDTADSGQEALALIKAEDDKHAPFDVVFLDWLMPGLTGTETAQEMKKLNLRHPPKCIVVTAHGREEVIFGAQAAGIHDVLVKPVNASMLFDTVIRVMASSFAASSPTAPKKPRKITATPVTQAIQRLRGGRVLLVEDNKLNQDVGAGLLTYAGMVVDIAENGEIALQKVQAHAYDVILMDMQMPVMDGVTATQEIRKLRQYDHVPVIAMTANVMQSDRDKCRSVGMVDFVAKPISPELLWSVLLRWMPERARATPSDVPSPVSPSPGPQAESFEVPGLNVKQGLKRTLGNRVLYERVLRLFVKDQATAAAHIQQALQDSDWVTGLRLVHTLKSSSGTVGAEALQQASTLLETAMQSRHISPEVLALADQVSSLLSDLVHQLGLQLGQSEEAVQQGSFTLAEGFSVCSRLLQTLVENDAEAVEQLVNHTELIRWCCGAQFPALEHSIQVFDFSAARQQLESVLALLAVAQQEKD